jgi:hypothetical protein
MSTEVKGWAEGICFSNANISNQFKSIRANPSNLAQAIYKQSKSSSKKPKIQKNLYKNGNYRIFLRKNCINLQKLPEN